MDRVAEFLDDRLRGRPVPADLRRLVELQLDGELAEADCPPLWEVRLLSPGERHSLEEPAEPLASDPNPDLTRASGRAMEAVLTYVAPVVDGFNGDLFGYWLHPDEAPDPNPPIVKLDTEGQFSIVDGTTLVEAMIFDWAGDDDDAAPALAYCDAHGIPVTARSRAQLREVEPAVRPETLFDALYEQESRYHTPLAVSTDDAVPIGLAGDDPRVLRTLALHGFPADLRPLIAAADTGAGEVTLAAPGCAAGIVLRQRGADSWFTHMMIFHRPDGDRPQCTDLPYGFRMAESRAQLLARFGEPDWKGARGNLESWYFGPVEVHVSYGADDAPQTVRVIPKSLTGTFRYFG